MAHTKGPWEVQLANSGPRIVKAGTRDHVIALGIPKRDDARLIAAAPDLLEACRLLVDSYVAEAGTYALGELSQAREKARAALKLTEARS